MGKQYRKYTTKNLTLFRILGAPIIFSPIVKDSIKCIVLPQAFILRLKQKRFYARGTSCLAEILELRKGIII